MRHLRTISVQTPARALAVDGLFEKITSVIQNIVDFIQGLFGGAPE